MCGLPLALAHVQLIGACRAAPVDEGRSVGAFELAELPEGFARSRAAATVDAVRNGARDAARLGDEVGQSVRETVCLELQPADLGPGRAHGCLHRRRMAIVLSATSWLPKLLQCVVREVRITRRWRPAGR
ncbi:MAG: hypothetical protein BGN89_14860 [Alphaproteobacteria bacterium 64-6]|nr:MAG: hypothetical protein BGN89_14860 [Alphaproteobacteria bacterium 64-6]